MKIQPIQPNSPTFGYSNQLKTLYRQGKLPVRYGFYGGTKITRNINIIRKCRKNSWIGNRSTRLEGSG